ncbi:MAG TPA: beta/gamma crystallin-related protein, partial [Rhodocyclaceae bacterium]|nr:beta/gamma crystallin-related protein [Rhodocyclaceae bacterium]
KFICGAIFLVPCVEAFAQVTFYEGEGFRGRAFTTDKPVRNFQYNGFNDRASSVIVDSGRWEVCEDAGYLGNCVVLRPGSYDSLARMGMNKRVSSVRPAVAHGHRVVETPEPLPAPTYEYRRRPGEPVFNTAVTSVHAVMGPADRHCWIEREQVSAQRRNSNVGGAIVGAIVGGILGHQIGGGSGRDIATAGGAVAGAAIGSNVGNNNDSRNVRHCETTQSGPPDYWDVTYNFRGVEHRVQMSAPPGPTITVNENGEPRQ